MIRATVNSIPQSVAGLAVVSLGMLLLGCGGGEASRYRVQGSVTFDGKPVPTGTIMFEPDAAAGNAGPAGSADIVDGKYDTGDEKGIIGGPHVVYIDGSEKGGPEDQAGKQLFSQYLEKVDFPKAAETKDFNVPASAANAKPQGATDET